MKKLIFLLSLIFVFFVAPLTTMINQSEASLSIDATYRGWYNSAGEHESWNGNTLTGEVLEYPQYTWIHRSFFVFDLSNISGIITEAKLRLELSTYQSSDSIKSFTIFDVNTTRQNLISDWPFQSTIGKAIFSDLGSGSIYGNGQVTANDVGSIIEIYLSQSAISYLNTSGLNYFAVGIALEGVGDVGTRLNYIRFSNTEEARTHQLILSTSPVPIPSAVWLLGSGLIGLMTIRKKLKK